MTKSVHSETSWKDIADFVSIVPLAWLFILPGSFLESCAARIEKFAKEPPVPSPLSVVITPLKVIANDLDRAASIFSDKASFLPGSMMTAAVPAVAVGAKAAFALGLSWSTIAAGGHLLGMAGAVLGGIGVAVAIYPVMFAATACAATLVMGTALAAKDSLKILQACGRGLRESFAWRPAAKQPVAIVPAAAAVVAVPVGEVLESPPLMQSFNRVVARMNEEQDEAERIRFLKDLRRKYPEEFADALRLESHAPELRKDIQVSKPLSLRHRRSGGLFGAGSQR